MKIIRNIVVLSLPLFFAASCVHVHPLQGPSKSRNQGLKSGKSCKSRCMEQFHSCKSNRGKGKGASKCAHQKNACKSRC